MARGVTVIVGLISSCSRNRVTISFWNKSNFSKCRNSKIWEKSKPCNLFCLLNTHWYYFVVESSHQTVIKRYGQIFRVCHRFSSCRAQFRLCWGTRCLRFVCLKMCLTRSFRRACIWWKYLDQDSILPPPYTLLYFLRLGVDYAYRNLSFFVTNAKESRNQTPGVESPTQRQRREQKQLLDIDKREFERRYTHLMLMLINSPDSKGLTSWQQPKAPDNEEKKEAKLTKMYSMFIDDDLN